MTVSALRPLKRGLAKAKPAREQKRSTDTVVTVETMRLLTRDAEK